jgi:hypothetical protein
MKVTHLEIGNLVTVMNRPCREWIITFEGDKKAILYVVAMKVDGILGNEDEKELALLIPIQSPEIEPKVH